MTRLNRSRDELAISYKSPLVSYPDSLGFVFSGGGARAAYQLGCLQALLPRFIAAQANPNVIIGSSIGAINGLLVAASVKKGLAESTEVLRELWLERTYKNTFAGTPSLAFLRAVKVAVTKYLSPSPHYQSDPIFDPSPLMRRVDQVIDSYGGLSVEGRASFLQAVAVMTTVEANKAEGTERAPLLFLAGQKELSEDDMRGASFKVEHVKNLSARHGFASAALPAVLPPVEIDVHNGKVKLVDGGISQNIPVDPAVRLGAKQIIIFDCSGRKWWFDRYKEPHDTRPEWEVPAGLETYCMRPLSTLYLCNKKGFGKLLQHAVGRSSSRFIKAVGPVWPIFSLVKKRLGEEAAYEVMSYVALDHEFIQGLIEQGFDETNQMLKEQELAVHLKSFLTPQLSPEPQPIAVPA